MAEVLCPVVLARERELAVLADAVDVAIEGVGAALTVVGEAGIGKTRLISEVARAAQANGVAVLWGRAVAGHPAPSFRPIAEALMGAVRASGPPEDPELTPFVPALARVIPAWSTSNAGVEQPLVVVAEAVRRLLRSLAPGRASMLVVEDLHWADAETLGIFEYLADNAASEPLLVVGTMRGEDHGSARTVVEALRARRSLRVIELDRLADADIDRMLCACLDTDDVPEEVGFFVRSRSDGVPFLVEELLAGLVDSGALARRDGGWAAISRLVPAVPLTFADSVRHRLRTTGADARQVLDAAAVLGRDFNWELLPDVSGVDEDVVSRALQTAVELQLLTVDDRGFRFRHALTRDAVLVDVLPPDRARLSARAACALEEQGDVELAAELYLAAGAVDRSADLLHRSAQRSLAIGALVSAEIAVERARALVGASSELDETLLEVLALSGQTGRVRQLGQQMLRDLSVAKASSARVVGVHLRLARAAVVQADWPDGQDLLDRARLLTDDAALLARIDALAAHCSIGAGDDDSAIALAERALSVAERLGLPDVECEALEVIGRAARHGDVASSEVAFERARHIAERNHLELWRLRALHELGTIDLLDTGRTDRLVEARALAVQAGAISTLALIDLHLAWVLFSRDRIDDAEEPNRRCIEVATRLGLSVLPMALVQRAGLAARRRDRDEMEEAIGRAVAAAPDDPEVGAGVWGRVRALCSLAEADDERARGELDEAMRLVRRHPGMPFPYRGLWALLRTAQGVDGEAAREEVRVSGTLAVRWTRGCLYYADAVGHGEEGRFEAAAAAFAEADATLERFECDWFRHQAHRIVADAALRHGWGQPEVWLREALDWFDNNGEQPAASACRARLRTAGLSVPRRRGRDVGVPVDLRAQGVTRREMDVLELVAEGLSNAEIGRRLFLSPRTVENHVASLLTRTGSRGRTQLAAIAIRNRASALDG